MPQRIQHHKFWVNIINTSTFAADISDIQQIQTGFETRFTVSEKRNVSVFLILILSTVEDGIYWCLKIIVLWFVAMQIKLNLIISFLMIV